MHSDILARNLILLDVVDKLSNYLKKENIEIILLKGAALIELEIFKPFEREMSDIDIFVRENDKDRLEKLLKKIGFSEMPESSTAYFKEINSKIPPAIVDIHTFFPYRVDLNEIWNNKIKIKENIFSLPYPDMIIFSVMHAVLNHGYFGEKDICDIRKILANSSDSEKIKLQTIKKSKRLGISKFILQAFSMAEIQFNNSDIKFNLKELTLSPLIHLAFKKHYTFNEYLLPFLYNPSFGFKMLFPSQEFMIRRYGSNSPKNRAKRILSFIFKMRP